MAQTVTIIIPKNQNAVIDTSQMRTVPIVRIVEAQEAVGTVAWSNASGGDKE